jgi:aminoglycoside/choline kinase family phosphotransferase
MTETLDITVPTHTPRRNLMQAFVEQAGWQNATLSPLAGDASFRRYERVFAEGKQAVLMDAPPEKENVAPFVQIAHYLEELGLSAPHILAEDRENGFLLLEDLGDDSYTRLLQHTMPHELPMLEQELYHAAVSVLAKLHLHNRKHGIGVDVPDYGFAALMREIELFCDWYLPAVMGQGEDSLQRGAEFKALWADVLQRQPLASDVLVLRDYHADNLLWLPDRGNAQRVGLLDFQDALVGHAAYDLVSLLEDARRDVLPQTVESSLAHYCELTQTPVNELMAAYALLGAQRQAKIIGIFVRLGVRDGKTHYTRYLPRVWAHFEQDLQHPWLADIQNWVNTHIPSEWRGAIDLKTS